MEDRRQRRRDTRWLLWALLAVLGLNAWGLGGVHPPVIAVSCWLLAWALLFPGSQTHSFGAGAWLLFGLVCAAQCIPLPTTIVSWVAEDNAKTWTRTLHLLGEAGPIPISVEPESTRLEAARFALYAAVWWVVMAAPRRLSTRRVASLVAALALSVLLLTALHTMLGATKVFGFYERLYPTTGHVGPFINNNSSAGLYNLGAFAALSLALDRATDFRVGSAAAATAAVLAAGCLLTGSRGGALTLVLGLLALGGLLVWRSRTQGHPQPHRRAVLILATAVLTLCFAALSMSPALRQELTNLSLEKLTLARWGFSIALAHPWFGTGRGAFGAEAGRFREEGGEKIYTHAENWLVEAITGWGVALGLLAVALFVWALIPSSPRKNSSSRMALSVGVLAVAAQNLVDLGLDAVTGLTLPFVVVLALLNRKATEQPNAPLLRSHSAIAMGRWPLFIALVGFGGWLLLEPPELAHVERRTLGEAYTQQTDLSARRQSIRAAVRRHPGDGFLLRLAAADALSHKDDDTLAWLNASLLREPLFGRTYLLLAEALRSAGRVDQALVALREAARLAPGLNAAIAQRVGAWSPKSPTLVVPPGEAGVDLLLDLADAAPELSRRLSLLDQALQRAPEDPRPRVLLADSYIRASGGLSPPCDDHPRWCLAEADAQLDAAEQLSGPKPPPALVAARARWFLEMDQPEEAFAVLRRDCPSGAKECGVTLLDAATRLSTTHLSEAAKHYVATHCTNTTMCANAELEVARRFERRSDLRSALEHTVRAAELSNQADLWRQASALAERQQLHARARRLAERASGAEPAIDVTR